MASYRNARVHEIDLLRFSAALMVVLFHYAFRGHAANNMSSMPYPALAPIARYGYLGVDLFFMISGFVISMTASNGDWRAFLTSRIVRLYPAYWACCTLTFLLTLAIGAPRFEVGLGQYLVNLTMLQDFFNVEHVDGVYWSLVVELKFYALVLIVLLLGKIQQMQRWLALWLLLSAALEFLPALLPAPVPGLWRVSSLLIADYSAYFIAGATCYALHAQGPSLQRWALLAGSLLLALHQSVGRATGVARHYGAAVDVSVALAMVTAFFGLMLLVSFRRSGFLGRRDWQLLGALTYPLYLLHQNIGYMIFNAGYPALSPHVLFWGVLALMILAAWVVHAGVEKKFAPVLKRAVAGLLARRRAPAGHAN